MTEALEAEGLEDQEQDNSDEKLLEDALSRFALSADAEGEIRIAALEDQRFSAGDQWDAQIKYARAAKKRPCLTINRLPQFIRQVTNDQRQNRPSIKVHPVDDKGDVETAKIIQGLIRHIEYNSNADSARDTAFDGAVRGGFGYYRVVTEYCDPTSFDQDILIKRIRDPLAVFFDPHSTEPDGSDANFAFIVEDISHDEYKAKFPQSDLASEGQWESLNELPQGWSSDKTVRIAEYFYKDTREETLVLLSNGESVLERDLAAHLEKLFFSLPEGAPPVSVVRKRRTLVPVVKWCKLNGSEILEKTEWPGKYIPIIPVYGEELFIDGKRILKGIVRDAKDPQRMYNVWKSAETEAIGLAPKAPWIADAKSIEGYEHIWNSANTESHSYLPYNSKGNLPPPTRQAFEPAVQAITQAAMLAADDLKATTGIFDASLGAKSNESSGIAIQRRNVQSQTSNFHFTDNLTRSIRHEGRILIDLIPHIYDSARAARIIGEDGEQKIVKLNQPTDEVGKDGRPLIYDLTTGKYDATVDVGPSFASKRQEAAAAMQELSKSIPGIGQAAPDLVVKFMDVPGAQELAERLKKTLPPHLVDDPDKKQPQIPPQMQQQMQQMEMFIQKLSQDNKDLLTERENRLIEIESKERIEMKKLEVQIELKRAELDQASSLRILEAELAQLNQRQALLNMDQPVDPSQMQQQQMPMDPMMAQEQDMAPMMPDGASYDGAEFGDGGLNPTGGASPGQPLEGQPLHDDPNAY